MGKYILLDSSPLSLLALPASAGRSQAIHRWAAACDLAGHRIIIPEIIEYEVRRELLRAGKVQSIGELDYLKSHSAYLPLTTAAMIEAANSWALARSKGRPTSSDQNIHVDVILAAQALTLGKDMSEVLVAKSNPRHLSLFVPCAVWSDFLP
jgi:hypothetical protein